jgi:hypothetical protein
MFIDKQISSPFYFFVGWHASAVSFPLPKCHHFAKQGCTLNGLHCNMKYLTVVINTTGSKLVCLSLSTTSIQVKCLLERLAWANVYR